MGTLDTRLAKKVLDSGLAKRVNTVLYGEMLSVEHGNISVEIRLEGYTGSISSFVSYPSRLGIASEYATRDGDEHDAYLTSCEKLIERIDDDIFALEEIKRKLEKIASIAEEDIE